MKLIKFVFISATLFSSITFAETFSATLDWSVRSEIGLFSSGVVDRIFVKPGQKIKKNDLLLTLDSREFDALEKRAKAGVVRAKERFNEAVREFDRSEELYDRQVLSDHGRQLVLIEKLESEALLVQAQADLVIARLHKERSQLEAPFDGIVIDLMASVGAVVNNELNIKPLVVVANNELMHAVVQLSNEQMRQFSLGMKIVVSIDGQDFNGVVVDLGMEPISNMKNDVIYRMKVSFSHSVSNIFRKGQAATVRLK